uniref:Fatty-acid and retinol-binding protein 1 n=1 Tax=Steinernema glaseri TaxID=37863 RepID=A0A1I8ALZ8_9BILA
MMFRSAVACLLLAVAISAAPLNTEKQLEPLPNDRFQAAKLLYKTLLPKEFYTFLDTVPEEDKAIVKEVMDHLGHVRKQKADSSLSKDQSVHFVSKTKLEALSAEAKAFVEEINSISGNFNFYSEKSQEEVQAVLAQYEALSDEARADLRDNVPFMRKLIRFLELQLKMFSYHLGEPVAKYQALPDQAREDFKRLYPDMAELLENHNL